MEVPHDQSDALASFCLQRVPMPSCRTPSAGRRTIELRPRAQPGQGTAPSLPTTGAEGTAIGVSAEAGAWLMPRLALGIEVSLPRRFRSLQEIDHLRVF